MATYELCALQIFIEPPQPVIVRARVTARDAAGFDGSKHVELTEADVAPELKALITTIVAVASGSTGVPIEDKAGVATAAAVPKQ